MEALKTVYPTAWASDSYARYAQAPSQASAYPARASRPDTGAYVSQAYGEDAYYPQEQQGYDGSVVEDQQQEEGEEGGMEEWDDDLDDEDNESQ
jgi:hypothetical protein